MKTERRLFSALAAAFVMVVPNFSGVHGQTAAPGKAAPAYYIAEFELTDREALRPYAERVESTFRPFSGRYIARGGQMDALEGTAPKSRIIIIAFDSLEQARAWYHSPAYAEIRPIRQRSGHTDAYIVEGLPK